MTPQQKFDLPHTEEDLIAIPPAATTAAAAAAISTTSTAAFDLRTRFIHVQGAPANLRAIKCRDGLLTIFCARHLHEAEAARAPGVPVGHDADPVHLPVYLEQLAQFVFRSIEVEVPNKDVLQANCL